MSMIVTLKERIYHELKLTVTPSLVSAMTFTELKQKRALATIWQAISAAHCWRLDQILQPPLCMPSSRRSLFGPRCNARLRKKLIAWSVMIGFRQWMTMKICPTSAAALRKVYGGCLRLFLVSHMLHLGKTIIWAIQFPKEQW